MMVSRGDAIVNTGAVREINPLLQDTMLRAATGIVITSLWEGSLCTSRWLHSSGVLQSTCLQREQTRPSVQGGTCRFGGMTIAFRTWQNMKIFPRISGGNSFRSETAPLGAVIRALCFPYRANGSPDGVRALEIWRSRISTFFWASGMRPRIPCCNKWGHRLLLPHVSGSMLGPWC